MDDDAERTAGADGARESAAGIEACDIRRLGQAVRVEPEHAVDREGDPRATVQQGRDAGCDLRKRRGLGGNHHQILRAQSAGIIAGGQPGGELAAGHTHAQSVRLDRPQVHAACNYRDVAPFAGEQPSQQAANAARTEDADLHGRPEKCGLSPAASQSTVTS